MKLIKTSLLILTAGALNATAQTTFSALFSDFNTNNLTGIADENSSISEGLSWGILVAETGNDFSNPITTQFGIPTSDGAELENGFRFYNGGLTLDQGTGLEGLIAGSQNITINSPGFGTGDSFALIWFQRGFTSGDILNAGDNYGILTDSSFVVPDDGTNNVPFFSNFAGNDPVRPANLTVQAVPEPTSVLLVSFASALLLRRRR